MQILVLGDSLVFGAWDFEKQGWVNRLRIKTEEKYNINHLVYNYGIPGETTFLLLERLENTLEAIEPEILIIQIGINDSLVYSDTGNSYVDINNFENNLNKIFEISKKFVQKVIFVGLINVDEKITNPFPGETRKECYKNNEIKKYNNRLKEFCKANSLDYIDVFGLLDEDDLYDGLHPNSKGHEKICERVWDYLEKKGLLS